MFFLISGGAASGKTTLARLLSDQETAALCHDADEVPAADASSRWLQLAAIRAGR